MQLIYKPFGNLWYLSYPEIRFIRQNRFDKMLMYMTLKIKIVKDLNKLLL